MILTDKSYIETPPDNTPLMHYLNIYQLLSILNSKNLIFSSVSLYKDASEATLSTPSYKEVSRFLLSEDKTPTRKDEGYFTYKDLFARRKYKFSYEDYWRRKMWRLDTFEYLIRSVARHFIFTHRWSISPTEDILMWDRYKDQGSTIGIKTTVGKIKNAFAESHTPLYMGKIKYKDYNKEHITGFKNFSTLDLCDPNTIEYLFYQAILHKRDIYTSEKEVRIVACYRHVSRKLIGKVYLTDIPFYNNDWGFGDDHDPYGGGYGRNEVFFTDIDYKGERKYKWVPRNVSVSINVNELIESIILSPYTEFYVFELIKDLVQRYSIDPDKVIKSSIILN